MAGRQGAAGRGGAPAELGPPQVAVHDLDQARAALAAATALGVVAHKTYLSLDGAALGALMRPNGLVADIKGMWRELALPDGVRRWVL